VTSRADDFTFYREYGERKSLIEQIRTRPGGADSSNPADDESIDCKLRFTKDGVEIVGRALVCPCFGRKKLSVTVRRSGDPRDPANADALNWPKTPVTIPDTHLKGIPFWPGDRGSERSRKSVRRVLEHFPDSDGARRGVPAGLIIVAGRTGSGKSTLARELVLKYVKDYLRACPAKERSSARFPHVVTFEDPVEMWFARDPNEAANAGIDYSPRVKRLDAVSLSAALRDALRQTPTVVYVGETRQQSDWRALLTFAGTGHLVITTAHAGSVVETMGHVLAAAGARTPAQRSEVANKIRTIVHLKPDAESSERIPALWQNTTLSVNAMTAEGLGSILPSADNVRAHGNMGRSCFVRRITQWSRTPGLPERALAWDLSGE
jgi:hypothetical protein